MALVIRGTAENSAASGADVTVTLPGGTAASDVVYAAYAIGDNDSVDQNMAMITAGYTELADVFGDGTSTNPDCNLGVYRKIMGGTPDSSYQVDGLGGADAAVSSVCHVWTGADQTTPEDATTTAATGIGAIPDSPSITTITNNAIVISVGAGALQDTSVNAPSGYGNQVDDDAVDISNVTIGMASILKVAFGAENPGAWTTWTAEADTGWAAATVALRPATAPAFVPRMALMGVG